MSQMPQILEDGSQDYISETLSTRREGSTVSVVTNGLVQGVHLSAFDAQRLGESLLRLAKEAAEEEMWDWRFGLAE